MNANTTALYMRLSQEDENTGESNSIKSQRDLLTDFVSNHPDISADNLLHFIDDGYSGVTFNRPALNNMLEQAKKGKIKCIIVKDFSRFGRNYIEAGTYLEQIFPFLGIRFLSVNDRYDSNEIKGCTGGLELGFKTLLHDLYSKDLGIKSKSGKLAKTKKGEHVGCRAPFGYARSKVVKNAWEIDGAAAITVKRVFELAYEGNNIAKIARILNAEGVLPPLSHRRAHGSLNGMAINTVHEVNMWRMENVSKILRDERYTGKIVACKVTHNKFRMKQLTHHHRDDWLIVPDAHEAIISQEVFDEVQSLLPPLRGELSEYPKNHILSGKIHCGHCGYALRRGRGNLPPYYMCCSHIDSGKGKCLSDTIYRSAITEVVLMALKTEMLMALSKKKQADKFNLMLSGENENISGEIKKLKDKVLRLKSSKETLFEEFTDGKIDKEQFVSKKTEYNALIEDTEAKILKLSGELNDNSLSIRKSEKYDVLNAFDNLTELTPAIVSLVKDIIVYDGERIEVIFDFADRYCDVLSAVQSCESPSVDSKTALYCHVTLTDDVSREIQEQSLIKFAEENSYSNCVCYCDNGEGGYTLDRPALQRLINDIKAGKVKTVIALSKDYLFRGAMLLEEWHKFLGLHEAELITVNGD